MCVQISHDAPWQTHATPRCPTWPNKLLVRDLGGALTHHLPTLAWTQAFGHADESMPMPSSRALNYLQLPRSVSAPVPPISSHVGLEHEMLLEQRLSAMDIPFWTESDMRAHGYFKTPDIWLQVPVAVLDRHAPGGPAWRLVAWIDSKATFGDDRIHAKQQEEQYSTYVNRYGPGLVIYWFGALEGLGHEDVMVLDAFPQAEDVRTLNR